jgi:hypothetical protein
MCHIIICFRAFFVVEKAMENIFVIYLFMFPYCKYHKYNAFAWMDYLLFVWIKFSRICWTIYILNLLNVHNDFLFRLVHKLNTSIHILNFIIYIMNLLYIYICIFNHSSKCIIFVVFTIRKHKQINYKDIFHGFLNNKKRSKTYDDMTHLFSICYCNQIVETWSKYLLL